MFGGLAGEAPWRVHVGGNNMKISRASPDVIRNISGSWQVVSAQCWLLRVCKLRLWSVLLGNLFPGAPCYIEDCSLS